MSLDAEDLEKLIAHEARYFEIWARVTRTPQVWFLDSPDLPNYQSANRAFRLRFEDEAQREGGPELLVSQIIAHYRERSLPVVVDVDPAAETLGFGRALRQRGVTPVVGSMLLMHYGSVVPPLLPTKYHDRHEVTLTRVVQERDGDDIRDWIELAGCDAEDTREAAFWQAVAVPEARSPDCQLYLARVEGRAVGACQLFTAHGWAQIDSVMTHPDFRRRGIASRLVAQAVTDSLALGNARTYLYTDKNGPGEPVYRRLGFEVWGVDIFQRHLLY